jgi:hypothetical protein
MVSIWEYHRIKCAEYAVIKKECGIEEKKF